VRTIKPGRRLTSTRWSDCVLRRDCESVAEGAVRKADSQIGLQDEHAFAGRLHELDELCRDLVESIQREGDTSIVLKSDIASEPLPTDRAIPLRLIVNELVTNAVRYAFPGDAAENGGCQ
jgi:signal transduction histidine kinase